MRRLNGFRILGAAEVFIGLVSIGIGLLALQETIQCGPARAFCCIGWIPVFMFLPPGGIALAAGCLAFHGQGRRLRITQIVTGTVIFTYFAALTLLWVLLLS